MAQATGPTTATVNPAKTRSLDLAGDPAAQAYLLLRVIFTVAPIAFGLDKFANVLLADWTPALAGWVNDLMPGTAAQFMHVVGVVEIAAGVLVAIKPRIGAYVVAAWLGGIIVNLVTGPGLYDIALRDVGLMAGAIALGRLSAVYDR